MPAKYPTLTRAELDRKAKLIAKINAMPTLRAGGADHKFAKDRLTYLLAQEQEKVAYALIRQAKAGNVLAIVEFFNRLYGKSKETIDFNGEVQFSLKALAERARLLGQEDDAKVIDVSSVEVDGVKIAL